METLVIIPVTLLNAAQLIVYLEEQIEKKWHLEGKWSKYRTWAIGVLLGLAGYVLQVGLFAKPVFGFAWMPEWLADSLIGFLAAKLANWGYDKIALVKKFAKLFRLEIPIGDESKQST